MRAPAVMITLVLLLSAMAGCISETNAPASQPAPAVGSPATSPAATAAVTAPAASSAAASDIRAALTFDAARAFGDVEVLAAPEMQGRHAGTPGERKGAAYLAAEFQKAGLQPAGDRGGFLQFFPMEVTELTAVPTLTFLPAGGPTVALQLREHFRPLVGGPAAPGRAEGQGYFAGYAEDLSAGDVRGRVVIVVPARRALRDLLDELRRRGAAGVIATTGSQPMIKGELRAPEGDTLPVALLSRNGFDALMRADGRDPDALRRTVSEGGDLAPFALNGRIGMDIAAGTWGIEAINVLGLRPGDAGGDVIVVGAHYEEIGPDPDGVVFPAANDNASGTAVMLELARLLAQAAPTPRATVLFAGWSGHEEGLLGSEHFLKATSIAPERIKAYLNLDTVGNGSGNLTVATDDDTLRALITRSVDDLKATGADLTVDIQARRGGGSDDVNFRRRNIPSAAFAWGGLFPGGRIHIPEDDASNVDPAKLRATGQTAALLLVRLAAR